MDFLNPAQTVTCWIALDDTHRDAGTLEYAAGSHHWPVAPLPNAFHAREDYRSPMREAARAAGIDAPEPFYVEVPAGSCTIHAGELWHGSGPNVTSDRMRRSIGIHLLPEGVRFNAGSGGYIYRRYQRTGIDDLDESFFPLLWSSQRGRTDWIAGYLQDGIRRSSAVLNS